MAERRSNCSFMGVRNACTNCISPKNFSTRSRMLQNMVKVNQGHNSEGQNQRPIGQSQRPKVKVRGP